MPVKKNLVIAMHYFVGRNLPKFTKKCSDAFCVAIELAVSRIVE